MKTLIILSALLVAAVAPACAEDVSMASRYLGDSVTIAASGPDSSPAGVASEETYSESGRNEDVHTAKVKRSAGTAFVLSLFVPGLGQHYNGEHAKGAVQEVAFFGGAAMTVLSMAAGFSDSSPSWSGGAAVTGFIICTSAYVWSVFDAPISAFRINDEIDRSQRTSMQLGVGDYGAAVRVAMLPAGVRIELSHKF